MTSLKFLNWSTRVKKNTWLKYTFLEQELRVKKARVKKNTWLKYTFLDLASTPSPLSPEYKGATRLFRDLVSIRSS